MSSRSSLVAQAFRPAVMWTSVVLFAVATSVSLPAQTPPVAKEGRARAKEMLATMKDAVKTSITIPPIAASI